MTDLRRNIRLSNIVENDAGMEPNAAGFAKVLGRKMPFQGIADPSGIFESGSPKHPILGEVAQDVFTEDGCGRSIPGGTLWVRHQLVSEDEPVFGDRDRFWTAVPSVLPAGFTPNNKRNCFPKVNVFQSAQSTNSSVVTSPVGIPAYNLSAAVSAPFSGSSGKPIRTADGIYAPLDSTDTWQYGPCNRGQEVSSWGGGEITRLVGSQPIGICAGWRTLQLYTSWHPDYFIPGPDPHLDWIDFIICMGDDYLTTSDVFTHRVNSGDLVLGADLGDPSRYALPAPLTFNIETETAAAAGEYQFFGVRGVNSLGVETVGNVNWYMKFAPRIDIPYPFTASSGNLVAPGGIVTGSIPGY